MKKIEIDAKNEDPEALFEIGLRYKDDDNFEKAFEYFNKGSQKGHAGCQHQLGMLYDLGAGVVENKQKAFELYTKSANKIAGAQYNLAHMYFYGKHVNQDYDEAKNWYSKASQQGHMESLAMLGAIAQYGYCGEEDLSGAIEMFKFAAEGGSYTAQGYLGACYFHGDGVEKDYAKAAKLLQEAAIEGFGNAQFLLGVMYYEGLHFEKHARLGGYWINLARKDGHEFAQEVWDKLKGR